MLAWPGEDADIEDQSWLGFVLECRRFDSHWSQKDISGISLLAGGSRTCGRKPFGGSGGSLLSSICWVKTPLCGRAGAERGGMAGGTCIDAAGRGLLGGSGGGLRDFRSIGAGAVEAEQEVGR